MATAMTRIGPTDQGQAMTLQQFMEADETPGYRYELARGVLEVTEVPSEPHNLIEWFLLGRLRDYERDHPGVFYRVGSSGSTRIWLPGMVSGRNPDIAVVLPGAARDHRKRRIAAMVIEIVSPGSEARERDYNTKREEYLAYGLREYWIVDPVCRRVVVLTRDGDVWAERSFDGERAAEGLILPGFAVRPDDIWAAAGAADDLEG